MKVGAGLLLALIAGTAAPAPALQAPTTQAREEPAAFRADALAVEPLIDRVYAYRERLSAGSFRLTPKLRSEAEAVSDRRSLIRFAERALLLLADHHAITGASTRESWALVPSYSDLWIEESAGRFAVDAVREGSPAQAAGLRSGDELVAVDGLPAGQAVEAFWADLGTSAEGSERAGFAARVLAAGRRDSPRRLTIRTASGATRQLELASLYAAARPNRPPLMVRKLGRERVIRFNDSLGDSGAITAFDSAMSEARPGERIVIDLRDTPGGGNTSVARAVLGWFVERPRSYQVHSLPVEERETGIARQWVEQVLPRAGKRHKGPVRVLVGRWTGSMGEGLAVAFDAIGAGVSGGRMAGLLGAIYDHRLERSGLVLKLPTERLFHVDGTPREAFAPKKLPPRSRRE